MKKIIATVIAVCLCLALAGCSKKNPVTGYKSGDVTLGQYKGLTYTKASTEVSDDAVESKINSELANHSERVAVTDRTVETGDTVNIDYVGKVDGVAFEGGSASGTELEIGSGRMIPGFEDGIIGFALGETRTIDVTFPEEYSNSELAGKAATFDITVNSIFEMVLPELTEEFVKETLEYDSIAAYRDAVRAELKASAEEDAEAQKFNDVISAAVNNATFNKDLSEEITKAKNSIVSNYDSMAQSYYGVDAKTLFQALYGMTDEQYDTYMTSQAESNAKYNYLLSAVADVEKITVTDDEIRTYAESLLSSYGVASVDELYAMIKQNTEIEGKTMITEQVKLNKASDLIVESAVPAE